MVMRLNANTMDIKKYNNIKDKYKSPNTKILITISKGWGETDEINDFKFPNEKDFYFSYIVVLEDCVYQLEKSKDNTSIEKISEFSDDYMLNGHNDEYEDFDETNEVFEGNLYESCLFKIRSDEISSELNNRLEKFINEKGKDCNFEDFFKLLDPDSQQEDDIMDESFFKKRPGWIDSMSPDGSYHYILQAIGIDPKDIETIYRDVTIDDNGDIVCWYQFSEFIVEKFSIEIEN